MRGLTLWLLLATLPVQASEWEHYGGDAGGQRYSTLTQISRNNVRSLERAWTYQSGEVARRGTLGQTMGWHATPILLPREAGGHLVLCTPFNRIVALDPTTGVERWVYDADVEMVSGTVRYNCRGVALWRDETKGPEARCAFRILMGTFDHRWIAVDGRDGTPCAEFAAAGQLDLKPVLRATTPESALTGIMYASPPGVVGDIMVMGSTANAKFRRASAPDGSIRAFNARTGEAAWVFETIPRNPQAAAERGWSLDSIRITGGANAWSMLSVDQQRDLVFIPTASPAPDFYGGLRPGDNRYGNSLLAVRGSTGELVWHFQIVHHDVWDYDLPAQPILTEILRDGERVPVVVQLTKQGMVFIFHRETGEPFFPIEERPVPTDGVPGDTLWPTQPFPTKPPALVPHGIGPEDAWGMTPYDRGVCRGYLEDARTGDIYTPPSVQGTVLAPATSGGSNWGGGAVDPTRGILITNVSRLAFLVKLIPLAEFAPQDPPSPMAGMPMGPPGALADTPYALEQRPLLSPFFTPCTAPPWAELVAVDLGEGDIKWHVPLGTLDKLMPVPLPLRWGTPTAGGPIVTAGGLVFIGATMDERLRAFDIDSGEQLWQAALPTAAAATPMTYAVDGRQYVVIVAGGHLFQYPFKIADYVVAFTLPES